MRQMIAADISLAPLPCTACGTTEEVVIKAILPKVPICKPCFIVWYDPDDECNSWADVGRQSLARKAAGKFPYDSAKQEGKDNG